MQHFRSRVGWERCRTIESVDCGACAVLERPLEIDAGTGAAIGCGRAARRDALSGRRGSFGLQITLGVQHCQQSGPRALSESANSCKTFRRVFLKLLFCVYIYNFRTQSHLHARAHRRKINIRSFSPVVWPF